MTVGMEGLPLEAELHLYVKKHSATVFHLVVGLSDVFSTKDSF